MSVGAEAAIDRTFGSLLDAAAARASTLGGGSVAALAGASAAALVERCAATSPAFDDVRLRAGALRTTFGALVDEDSVALAALIRTRHDAPTLAAASEPPARMRLAARELADLASSMERDGAPALRAEAQCALILAMAVAAAAEAILAANAGAPAADG